MAVDNAATVQEIERIILKNGTAIDVADQAQLNGVKDLRQAGLLKVKKGLTSLEEVEAAVLNVARYDVFKLGEAVLAGQTARVLRMLDGRIEGDTQASGDPSS
mgnify:CR=1 FL=1